MNPFCPSNHQKRQKLIDFAQDDPRKHECRGKMNQGEVPARERYTWEWWMGPRQWQSEIEIWWWTMMNHDFKAFWKNVSHFRVSLHCGYLHRRCFLMGIHSLLGMWCLGRVLLWYNKKQLLVDMDQKYESVHCKEWHSGYLWEPPVSRIFSAAHMLSWVLTLSARNLPLLCLWCVVSTYG